MIVSVGEFPVVEIVSNTAVRIALGPGTSFVVHLVGAVHRVKLGDRLPLLVNMPLEIIDAKVIRPSIQ